MVFVFLDIQEHTKMKLLAVVTWTVLDGHLTRPSSCDSGIDIATRGQGVWMVDS
jgi:hypothetical protein